jgi:cysteine desulfurase/selenocysteine lyase
MKLNNDEAKKLKKNFPIFKNNPGLIYLDSAATSQKPESVIKAMTSFYENENANVSRGLYDLAEKATKRYEEARETVAKFIGAESKEIVFTRNATEAINLLSYTIESLVKYERNEILLTEMEHHSNLVPWQQLAKRKGMRLKFVKIRENFTLDIADLKSKLTNRTAIVALTHASNVLGTINPVKEIIELGKSMGAITVIDASQSIQNIGIDVKYFGCDFLVFSSHKMLGPTGIGVLYGRKELLEQMRPFNFGGGMIKRVSLEDAEWADIPQKFEAGTQNIAEAIGLGEAIKYIQDIGIENIHNWEKELTKYALNKMKEIPGLVVYNPGSEKSVGIVSFNIEGVHPHDVADLLNSQGIAIRAGHHCAMPLMKILGVSGTCRASFSIYNTFEDVDALVKCLKRIQEKFEK